MSAQQAVQDGAVAGASTGNPYIAAGAAGLSFMSGQQANASSNWAMKKQLSTQVKFAKHGIQWRMEDLERSGLNRILAAGGTPPASGGQASAPQFRSPGAEAAEAAMQALALKEINSRIAMNMANAKKANNEAEVTGAKVPFMQTVGKVSKQALDTIVKPVESTAKKVKTKYKEIKKHIKPSHQHYFQSPQYFKFGR